MLSVIIARPNGDEQVVALDDATPVLSVDRETLQITKGYGGDLIAVFAPGSWTQAIRVNGLPDTCPAQAEPDALAEWEKELLADEPEPEPLAACGICRGTCAVFGDPDPDPEPAPAPEPKAIAVGDVVRITEARRLTSLVGLHGRVTRVYPSHVVFEPLAKRGDTGDRRSLTWSRERLERVGTPSATRVAEVDDLVLVKEAARWSGGAFAPARDGALVASVVDEVDQDGDVYVRGLGGAVSGYVYALHAEVIVP